MKVKILDTNIVYSAVSDDEQIVRFALHPVLDGCAFGEGKNLRVRAVVGLVTGSWLQASCRSPGCKYDGPWIDETGSIRTWTHDDDGWLEWLAEGEPGR